MATAKSTSTTRRASSGTGSKKDPETEVSPARWGGVALVIAAIVAAIMLAMVSPSQPTPAPGSAPVEPSPTPEPTQVSGQVPVAQPEIVSPISGKTAELDFPAEVRLPDDDVPRKLLRLYILHGDDIVGELDRPKTGETVVVPSVRVDEGPNELVAVLDGPGGWGPLSEPVLLTVDRDAPELAVTSPKNKSGTYEDTVIVEGTSQVGAKVRIHNLTNGHKATETVGNSGTFDIAIRLKRGVMNRIEARSIDEARIPQLETVRVNRLDGRPRVKIKEIPPIRRSELPAKLRIVVDVTDAKDKPMPEARVDFALGGRDRTADTETLYTNAEGRAVWKHVVEPSSSVGETLELSVTVTSPLSGDPTDEARTIEFR